VLDAHGCAALWGCREDGWTGDALARGVCATLTANGIGVRAGCGPSPLVARLVCAQTQPGAVRALAPAEAETCIRRLPLGDPALGLPAPVVSALHDVGVRRVADFLRLSYAAVVERWGAEAGTLHRQLADLDIRPLRRWTAAPALVLHRTVDDCASALVVDAILGEMCADLQTRLATAAQAAVTVTLRVTLDGDRQQIQQSRHWPALHTLVPLRQAVLALRARCSIDAAVGERTYDVYLNDIAYWSNVPANVWEYTIGGYQVLKKWLSYREDDLLGRPLTKDEARDVMHTARRSAALLLLDPALDANYQRAKQGAATDGVGVSSLPLNTRPA